ncbi:hypothetical protein A1O3_08967 [Capronia epimyces CBS 606.96]|uniref:CMP/dCMP-type deaminase domain-containing protein n=1 Tax=Capronia epimyces CBS 606.96 TaxID=1182542 RepID=W9XQ70_9EURO|nr:uncharacterized protein A1O3_08967 [Capronia epimyces CBS 606.96]EXJ79465.1 hypothetical protein A1O3_08967 [Capronia epimyces CBS 606.96]
MSYQQFLESTAKSALKTPSPGSIHRKPPSALGAPSAPSPSAAASGSPSIHSSVTRNTTVNSSKTPFVPTPPPRSPARATAPTTPPPRSHTTRTPLTKTQIDSALKACLDLQYTATSLHAKRPFAALLLAPDNTTILLTHFSISHFQHAETELARLAATHFSQKYLASCTLVSTWEPCAMCTGTLYWSNIGRVVYAASESKLRELTGGNNEENMTMSLPCREVLKGGQKDVEVIGPVGEWEEKVVEQSAKWWNEHQTEAEETVKRAREDSVNGSERPGSLSSVQQSTPTTWTGEDSVLSSIDDEGEYKAELDIDWMR